LIYVDTSVALAHLLVEEQRPPNALWEERLISSQLLQYELWTRIHGLGFTASHGESAQQLLARVGLVELAPPVLARALEPFPLAVRTLDALHLATIEFLRGQGEKLELASYDQRMVAAARRLNIPIAVL
jgi:predicted nucleic acid-binding protein